ncbi:MAG TPA: hypothetical protein VFV87_10520, partial [Pirellulaceae bacterium]|nr:hypothetical protein [Pirellulaceae bacterium]
MFGTLILVTGLVLGQNTEKAQAEKPAVEQQAAAANADLAKKVAALVRQLDSNQQAQREAAEKDLVELGPDVLPHLPALTPRTPAEVRNRLSRVRTALMKAEIEAATKPAMVTLSGEMLFSEAAAQIAEQTGNKLIDYRERFNQEGSDPKIKVDVQGVPFWEALDTVLDAANLTIYNYDEEQGALAYTSRGDNAVPRVGKASYSGLFRLEPTRVEAVRDLRNSNTHSLKLVTDAIWEPRIRPIVLEFPLADVSATDESGSPIEIDRATGTLEVPADGTNSAVEIEFPLVAPSRNVKQLASIKAKLTAVVLGKIESFEFADLDKLKSAELERGGVTVIVESCRKNGDIYDVSMRVRFDKAANALESHRGWIYNNECYLLDPKGQRNENAGLEATLLDVNEVGLSYKFDLGEAAPAGHTF